MSTLSLRLLLALMLAGAVALGTAGSADAQSKRSAYKKPKVRAYVQHPYVPPGVLNERECPVQYDNRGVPLPYYMHCDAAFRRLYSR